VAERAQTMSKMNYSDEPSIPEKMIKAPWNLSGQGYMILYRFKKQWVEDAKQVPSFLAGKFLGGFGSIMIVNYQTSDAGPYGELLFIPGKFNYRGKNLNTISTIYVSTNASVVNGIENWAIPKVLADFKFRNETKNVGITLSKPGYSIFNKPAAVLKSGLRATTEEITVAKDTKLIAKWCFTPKCVKFPLHTSLLPFPLVQMRDGKEFYTKFSGYGLGQFCTLNSVEINPDLFPDVTNVKPIAIIKVNPFHICFPEAIIRE
jgi:hypothetical protein